MPKGDRPAMPVAERLAARNTVEGECWRSTYTHNDDGYAWLTVGSRKDGTRRLVSVHCASYAAFHGPIPEGYEVDHLCHTRDCWRPEHLRALPADEHRRLTSERSREASSKNLALARAGRWEQ